jgi:hypothetical protein
MDQQTLELTRRALHGIAEVVMAGPQYAASQDIRLRVTPGGFGTVASPDIRVDGLELTGSGVRIPLTGTLAELAEAVGVEPRDLRDVYSDGPDVAVDEPLLVDPEAGDLLLDAFARGDVAMRAFAPGEEPVLWPEHFDIGITLDEVNYGVSPGDTHIGTPYAYAGPWAPREGAFWNMSFGAAKPLAELPGPDAVEVFFREAAKRAKSDPPRAS